MLISKSYKTRNPYRADQIIRQDVIVSDSLHYDYKDVEWIGVDTEFLSINMLQDKLCTIQISSEDPEDPQKIRTEIIYVFDKEADKKLKALMTDEKVEKILHTYSADLKRIEEFIGDEVQGSIYDVAIAAKVAITNLDGYSLENIIQYVSNPSFSKSKKITISEWDLDPEMWQEEQFEYAANDVLYLDVLKKRIEKIAERRGKQDIIDESMKFVPFLMNLHRNGYDHRIFN